MMRRLLLVAALILSACEEQPKVEPINEPIVVFAPSESGLSEVLADFTAETRIPVELIIRPDRQNTDLVISNSVFPPADVLISNHAGNIFRAADEGALRPLSESTIDDSAPAMLDPDGFWAAILLRPVVILTADEKRLPVDYDDLASAALRGRVCLLSSRLPASRALLANLINERGRKPAERVVRGWIRNLATAPFGSNVELQEALAAGTCEFGIAALDELSEPMPNVSPLPVFVTAAAVGVARHARQADSGQRLVEWLIREKQTAADQAIRPVNIAGWLDEEARLLAERAAYQ